MKQRGTEEGGNLFCASKSKFLGYQSSTITADSHVRTFGVDIRRSSALPLTPPTSVRPSVTRHNERSNWKPFSRKEQQTRTEEKVNWVFADSTAAECHISTNPNQCLSGKGRRRKNMQSLCMWKKKNFLTFLKRSNKKEDGKKKLHNFFFVFPLNIARSCAFVPEGGGLSCAVCIDVRRRTEEFRVTFLSTGHGVVPATQFFSPYITTQWGQARGRYYSLQQAARSTNLSRNARFFFLPLCTHKSAINEL